MELLAFLVGQRASDIRDGAARRVAQVLRARGHFACFRCRVGGLAVLAAKHHGRKLEVFRERACSLREPIGHRQGLAEVAAFECFLEIVQAFGRPCLEAGLVRTQRLVVDATEKLRHVLGDFLELSAELAGERVLVSGRSVDRFLADAPRFVGEALLLHFEVADRIHGLHQCPLAGAKARLDQRIFALSKGLRHGVDRSDRASSAQLPQHRGHR